MKLSKARQLTKDPKYVKCDHCSSYFAYTSSTSTMKSHLEKKHRISDKNVESQSKDIRKMISSSAAAATSIFLALCLYIIRGLRPLSEVDSDGFRQFCHALNSNFKVPCRKTITAKLEKLYDKLLEQVKLVIKTIEYACITFDFWSSKATELT